MKKVISLFLAMIMVIGLLPAMVFEVSASPETDMESEASGVIEGTDISWHFETRKLTISGSGAMPDYSKNDKKPWSGKWVM